MPDTIPIEPTLSQPEPVSNGPERSQAGDKPPEKSKAELIGEAEGLIDGFFGETDRHGRIIDGDIEDVDKEKPRLHQGKETAEDIQRRFQRTDDGPDPDLKDQVNRPVDEVDRLLDEQLASVETAFKGDGMGQYDKLKTYLRHERDTWDRGGRTEFVRQLQEATQEPDPQMRQAALKRMRDVIVNGIVLRVHDQSTQLQQTFRLFDAETSERGSTVRDRINRARNFDQELAYKDSDQFRWVPGEIEALGENATSYFRATEVPRGMLPLRLNVFLDAAEELARGISEVTQSLAA